MTIPCFTSQREDYAAIMLMLQEQLRGAGINLDLKIIDHATMHSENRKDRNSVALYSSSYPAGADTTFPAVAVGRSGGQG